MQAIIQSSHTRQDGTRDTFSTFTVDAKEAPLWWHVRGLSYTATGYGSRIPTPYMVKFNGKWRRVYCRQYSNAGTLYIGKLAPVGENLIVHSIEA